MKKLYCVICSKYRKFEKPKITNILEKTLVLSIICSKCKSDHEKIFKKEETTEMLKILGLIENMVEENISQEFRLQSIDRIRNLFLKDKEQNELMSKKHKNVCF